MLIYCIYVCVYIVYLQCTLCSTDGKEKGLQLFFKVLKFHSRLSVLMSNGSSKLSVDVMNHSIILHTPQLGEQGYKDVERAFIDTLD